MEKAEVKKTNHILWLEDNERDRELLEGALVSAGLACEFSHATSKVEFETALAKNTFDLIISDFSLPSYDGLTALATAQKVQSEAPFLFVSGTIGEERAIDSLKKGATDYVLKDRPDRLVSAVRRALQDAQKRRERQALEEQLRRAQKMEAIGQLASGVAHDFNNLLAVIQGNAELVLMKAEALAEQDRECLQQITFASQRAVDLTRQLLAFGRKQTMRMQPTSLNDVITNLTRMLKRIIGSNIQLQYSYTEQPVFALADAGMMEQVLLNLVVNARDAMPQGGQILISTTKVNFDEGDARLGAGINAGEFICMSVNDNGCGIPPELMSRIFEPFFTTKDVGKGTGLGLATVYGIVQQHHGWVDASSRVGVGTTFRVYIPAITPPNVVKKPELTEDAVRGGTERILLVEDDVALRLSTRRLLESFGYVVTDAASGRQALEIWKKHGMEFDLLVTDVVMPEGVNGRELADRLWEQSPELKVIFVSGHSLNVNGKDSNLFQHNKSYFLAKPFPSHVLIETVRRCLDGKPSQVLA